MAKKIFTAFGSCQMDAIAKVLCDYSEFSRQYQFRPIPQFHQIKPDDETIIAETIKSCDLLLYQQILNVSNASAPTSQQVLSMLPEQSFRFLFPMIRFEGYTPQLIVYDEISSLFVTEHDCAIVYGFLSGLDPETVTAILADPDFYEPADSCRWLESELAKVDKRERLLQTDIKTAAFLSSNWRSHRLFDGTLHPRRIVLEHLAEQVLEKLGIDATRRDPNSGQEVLRVVTPPIYPSTYLGLGLTFAEDFNRCLTTQGIMPTLSAVRGFMADYARNDIAMLRMLTLQKPQVIQRFDAIWAARQPIFPSAPISKSGTDRTPGSVRPVVQQSLPLTQAEADLLLACLSTNRETIFGAWQRWQKSVNLEQIPADQSLLLPRLYANLLRFHLAEGIAEQIQDVHRFIWHRNQQIRRMAAAILIDLRDASISAAVYGSSAAALDLYADLGERPVEQLDILIAPAFVPLASNVFISAGWQPECSPALFTQESYQYWVSQVRFRRFDQVPIVLHWRILAAARMTDFESRLDQLTLDPSSAPLRPYIEMQQVLACARAAQGGREHLIAICDVGMTLQNARRLNTDRVLEIAYFLQASLPHALTLNTISQLLGITIDPLFLARLNDLSGHELPAESLHQARGFGVINLSGFARFHIQTWRRILKANHAEPTIRNFLDYFKAVTGGGQLHHLLLKRAPSAIQHHP